MKKIILILLLSVLPKITNAKVYISEIMYDIEGVDTGREWLEIYNSGPESVDLSTYKLLENSINHKISTGDEGKSGLLESQKYAIIADNPEKFAIDFNASGLILDSAFSLKNDGEKIELIDQIGNIVDSISYSPDWGANGTGNTLQLHEGNWIPGEPTPLSENVSTPINESEDELDTSTNIQNSTTPNDSSHDSQVELSNYKEKISLKIGAGRDRFGIINSPLKFIATNNDENHKNIKYLWSFGDGDSTNGSEIKHSFYSPGIYNVVLNANNKEEQAVSRIKVVIKEPEIEASLITRGKLVDVMLINKSNFEVNFGNFSINLLSQNARKSFKFPKDTIIGPLQNIKIPSEITNFDLSQFNNKSGEIVDYFPLNLEILYPNKKQLFTFKMDSPEIINIITILEKFIEQDKKEEFHNLFSKIKIDS